MRHLACGTVFTRLRSHSHVAMNVIVEPLKAVYIINPFRSVIDFEMVRNDLPGVSAKEQIVQIRSIRTRPLRGRAILIVEGVLDVLVVSRPRGFIVASDGLGGQHFDIFGLITPDLVPMEASLRVVRKFELVKGIVHRFIIRLSRTTNIDRFRHEDDWDPVRVLLLVDQLFTGQQRVKIRDTEFWQNGMLLA